MSKVYIDLLNSPRIDGEFFFDKSNSFTKLLPGSDVLEIHYGILLMLEKKQKEKPKLYSDVLALYETDATGRGWSALLQKQYSEELFGIALKMTHGDRYHAQEALQITLISLYEKRNKYLSQQIRNFKALVINELSNRCIDIHRYEKRRNHTQIDNCISALTENALDKLVSREFWLDLHKAVRKLDTIHQKVFRICEEAWVEKMRFKDVAGQYGIKPSRFSQLKSEMFEEVRRILTAEYGECPVCPVSEEKQY